MERGKRRARRGKRRKTRMKVKKEERRGGEGREENEDMFVERSRSNE